MNADALREMLRRQPFEPLELRFSSGEVYEIRHPEFALVLKSKVIIGFPDSDKTVHCSLLHIASVTALQPN